MIRREGRRIAIGGKKADELRAIVAKVPSDRILVETDAPFLTPQPHRGQRNEPAYAVRTLELVAELRGVQECAGLDGLQRDLALLDSDHDMEALRGTAEYESIRRRIEAAWTAQVIDHAGAHIPEPVLEIEDAAGQRRPLTRTGWEHGFGR